MIFFLLAIVFGGRAEAQDGDLTENSGENDPLAIDPALAREARLPVPRPPEVHVAPIVGEVLTAISGVRETSHRETISVQGGWVTVNVISKLANRAQQTASIQIRHAVPHNVCDVTLLLCRREHCDAVPFEEQAGRIEFTLRDVAANSEVEARLSYSFDAQEHHGIYRFELPPRGNDPRVAPSEVTVSSDLLDVHIQHQSTDQAVAPIEPNEAIVFEGRVHRSSGTTYRDVVCGGRALLRTHVETNASVLTPRSIVLLLDVSPSTQGVARRRFDTALWGLLESASEQSEVTAIAFGARAERILPTFKPLDEVTTPELAQSTLLELGSATRIESAFELTQAALRHHTHRPLVVLVGDGTLTKSAAATRALQTFTKNRVEFSVVNLSDETTDEGLTALTRATRGQVVSPGVELDTALRRSEPEWSTDALARTYARPETHGRGGARITVRAGESATSYRAVREHAQPNQTAGAPTAQPLLTTEERTGLPRETVLNMLRQRVIPIARRCFRSDRRGRANYRARAEYVVTIARREISASEVRGRIPESLRECLATATDALDIPYVSDTIVVRYPIYVAPAAPEPVLELLPDVAREVDRLIPQP